jgi:hypothetical protein
MNGEPRTDLIQVITERNRSRVTTILRPDRPTLMRRPRRLVAGNPMLGRFDSCLVHQLPTFAISRLDRHSEDRVCPPHVSRSRDSFVLSHLVRGRSIASRNRPRRQRTSVSRPPGRRRLRVRIRPVPDRRVRVGKPPLCFVLVRRFEPVTVADAHEPSCPAADRQRRSVPAITAHAERNVSREHVTEPNPPRWQRTKNAVTS